MSPADKSFSELDFGQSFFFYRWLYTAPMSVPQQPIYMVSAQNALSRVDGSHNKVRTLSYLSLISHGTTRIIPIHLHYRRSVWKVEYEQAVRRDAP